MRGSPIVGQTCMPENYDMAALLDTLLAERAARMELQSGAPPRIVDLPGDVGEGSGVLDVAPLTRDGVLQLLTAIASPEQLRELELCGSITLTHIHSGGKLGIGRFRVTAEIDHAGVRAELQYLGKAAS